MCSVEDGYGGSTLRSTPPKAFTVDCIYTHITALHSTIESVAKPFQRKWFICLLAMYSVDTIVILLSEIAWDTPMLSLERCDESVGTTFLVEVPYEAM